GGRTHPVGQKPANAFHLYDMAGNVWQWTEDCYAESYAATPTDGHANENRVSDPRPNGTKKCMRVDRGGSWLYPAWLLRSATRERNPADYRDVIMGFRVARTLEDTKSVTAANVTPAPQSQQPPATRVVDLKASDGTILKATYFAAAKPGPAVLLYHQSNRTRKEWDMVARQLAAAGINTLTVDVRGHGETGGQESHGEARKKQWPLDLDAAFQYLISQPGVKGDVIGI